ncbi:cadherin-1-like [Protopterus annectens]|uniref:cadherin-1-like n=1 Tax=Protopterus annectens TaxID=7888 RepID=UPI001CFADCDD|nr:cadherin-1-like [Protopterus annectens]
MGSARVRLLLLLGLVLLITQVWRGDCEENSGAEQCQPGFGSDTYVFFVNTKHLEKGRTLGQVHFDDCTGGQQAVYAADDSHIEVMPDGTVTVKHHMKLHDGLKLFAVYACDSKAKNFSTSIAVLNEMQDYGHHPGHDKHNHHHHHRKHHKPHHNNSESDFTSDSQEELRVLTFRRQGWGQRRQKREWIIPPISVSENDRNKLPKQLVQVKSSKAKETPVTYSITGQGADREPKGIFIIDKTTGWLSVTQPLDREVTSFYKIFSVNRLRYGVDYIVLEVQ